MHSSSSLIDRSKYSFSGRFAFFRLLGFAEGAVARLAALAAARDGGRSSRSSDEERVVAPELGCVLPLELTEVLLRL